MKKAIINLIRNGAFCSEVYYKVLSRLLDNEEALISEKQFRIYRKYQRLYKELLELDEEGVYEENTSAYVWICWFQGYENAPELVKACIEPVKKNMPDRKIIILDEKNLRKYIKFPKDIEEKRKKGSISNAHFSDLI